MTSHNKFAQNIRLDVLCLLRRSCRKVTVRVNCFPTVNLICIAIYFSVNAQASYGINHIFTIARERIHKMTF